MEEEKEIKRGWIAEMVVTQEEEKSGGFLTHGTVVQSHQQLSGEKKGGKFSVSPRNVPFAVRFLWFPLLCLTFLK